MDLQAPSGRFDGSTHLFAQRVHFEDTDLSGVVYHANYLRWMERARSDMLRLLGIAQRDAFEAGEGAYAVTDLALRYLLPARLDDVVLVSSRLVEATAATCRLEQDVRRGDDLLCRATLRLAFVSPHGRARRQPRAWLAAFAPLVSSSPAEGADPA